MKIWYLRHSGFAIECDNGCTLVFDFYNDTSQVLHSVLARSSKVYVLVSHSLTPTTSMTGFFRG